MSRVGKLPIAIPVDVRVNLDGLTVDVSGPRGRLVKSFAGDIVITQEQGQVLVKPLLNNKFSRSMWGTARSIINSMVHGVTNGFTEELEMNGVGYKAAVKDSYINLTLAKSHNTKIEIPKIIKVTTPKQNIILLESVDKEQLGQFVATIVQQRSPEPYKGKGIRKKGQYVQRKEGKKN